MSTPKVDKSGIRSVKDVVVNLDFEKWNSNMREEDTFELFQCFDNLMGFSNCFTRTHEMFTQTLFYLSSNDVGHTPELLDKGTEAPYSWRGHLGGIEGLRQTGWTIFTALVIIDILQGSGTTFRIMGQGDNQVLVLSYSNKGPESQAEKDKKIALQHENTLSALIERVKLIGSPLKANETWSSSVLFIYGKLLVLNRVEMSQSLKRLLKMFTISNEGLPTVDSAMSSLVSNAMSATMYDSDGLVAFYLYCFNASYAVQVHFSRSYLGSRLPPVIDNPQSLHFNIPDPAKRTGVRGGQIEFSTKLTNLQSSMVRLLDESFITAMIMFPSVLIRKFVDPLTEALHYLDRYNRTTKDTVMRNYVDCMRRPGLIDSINNLMLVKDPLSINIARLSSASDSLKGMVSKAISSDHSVKNTNYLDLFKLANTDTAPFATALSTMIPLRPILNHEIYKTTPVGHAEEVVNQFSRTATLTRMLGMMGSHVVERLKRAEESYTTSVLYNLHVNGNVEVSSCSRRYAQALRTIVGKAQQSSE